MSGAASIARAGPKPTGQGAVDGDRRASSGSGSRPVAGARTVGGRQGQGRRLAEEAVERSGQPAAARRSRRPAALSRPRTIVRLAGKLAGSKRPKSEDGHTSAQTTRADKPGKAENKNDWQNQTAHNSHSKPEIDNDGLMAASPERWPRQIAEAPLIAIAAALPPEPSSPPAPAPQTETPARPPRLRRRARESRRRRAYDAAASRPAEARRARNHARKWQNRARSNASSKWSSPAKVRDLGRLIDGAERTRDEPGRVRLCEGLMLGARHEQASLGVRRPGQGPARLDFADLDRSTSSACSTITPTPRRPGAARPSARSTMPR